MSNQLPMVYLSTILTRPGWSKSLVTSLLGDPDLRKKIPFRTTVGSLYYLWRVEAAESSNDFQSAQPALRKRVTAARKAVKTKTDKLVSNINAMSVDVRRLSDRELTRQAQQAYNDHRGEWDYDFMPAGDASDKSFLDRITVNYIRHNLTKYDNALEDLARKTGKGEALNALRRKVYDAIAEAYPRFAEECRKQYGARVGCLDLSVLDTRPLEVVTPKPTSPIPSKPRSRRRVSGTHQTSVRGIRA